MENLGSFELADAPEKFDELPKPGAGTDAVVGATGATGPYPTDEVAEGGGVVGIENPEAVVGIGNPEAVVVVVEVVVVVVSGTVPTLPELVTVTLAVAVALAASAFMAPHESAAPLTEQAATRLKI